MNPMHIRSIQLFSLILLFELGSAIVVGVGMNAKQDAWLAILMGMMGGILFYYFIYGALIRTYPNCLLTAIVQKVFGKFLGIPVAVIYILYFLYLSARVLRDLGDLLLTSTLTETPLVVVQLLILLLIAYASYLGVEVLCRAGEIFLFVFLFLVLFGALAVYGSDIYRPENFKPVLEQGWIPVMKTAFPLTLTFPFGEIIAFLMIIPFMNHPQSGIKWGVMGILISGLVLAHTIALNIGVLGPFLAANTPFPLLHTIEKVNIGDFIQRLDAVVVGTLIIGCFFKVSIFFLAAIHGIQELVPVIKKGKLIIIMSLIVLVSSIKMSSSFTEHIHTGLEIVPYFLHLPLQFGFPLLLTILTIIKKKIST